MRRIKTTRKKLRERRIAKQKERRNKVITRLELARPNSRSKRKIGVKRDQSKGLRKAQAIGQLGSLDIEQRKELKASRKAKRKNKSWGLGDRKAQAKSRRISSTGIDSQAKRKNSIKGKRKNKGWSIPGWNFSPRNPDIVDFITMGEYAKGQKDGTIPSAADATKDLFDRMEKAKLKNLNLEAPNTDTTTNNQLEEAVKKQAPLQEAVEKEAAINLTVNTPPPASTSQYYAPVPGSYGGGGGMAYSDPDTVDAGMLDEVEVIAGAGEEEEEEDKLFGIEKKYAYGLIALVVLAIAGYFIMKK